jgi:hypothetical protein
LRITHGDRSALWSRTTFARCARWCRGSAPAGVGRWTASVARSVASVARCCCRTWVINPVWPGEGVSVPSAAAAS